MRASKVAQQVKARVTKSSKLNLIPETRTVGEA